MWENYDHAILVGSLKSHHVFSEQTDSQTDVWCCGKMILRSTKRHCNVSALLRTSTIAQTSSLCWHITNVHVTECVPSAPRFDEWPTSITNVTYVECDEDEDTTRSFVIPSHFRSLVISHPHDGNICYFDHHGHPVNSVSSHLRDFELRDCTSKGLA